MPRRRCSRRTAGAPLAIAIAPDDPAAWDAAIVADAAFGRYLREAADYAGGRPL
ncbi:MAG: hypothetical protein NVS2B6_14840 [Thermoleophilaceae bacterium]